jgi:hypothetical protein
MAGKSSPWLLVVSQRALISDVADALIAIWAVADPAELRDQVYHLPSLVRHGLHADRRAESLSGVATQKKRRLKARSLQPP